ncbi:hypothetical protein MJL33_30400, partial [Salmonella enterica subsp. enterica serovar Kentucky]|nr:hypothetical protein [Salmonella enterica subsp. enterica serovar Kentucky]
VAVLQKHILSGTQISFGIPSGIPEISTIRAYTYTRITNGTVRCKVAQTASHKRPSALDTLRYLASNARFRRGIVAQFLYVGMQV